MPDRSPQLLRRMLALRQFTLLARADLDELATVAENVVERDFATGELVAPADRLDSLHLILAGRLEHGTRCLETRDVFGALEVTAQRPARVPTIAAAPTRTLELGAAEYLEVLEDNFNLLLITLRDLAARVVPLAPARRVVLPEARSLGFVERVILLRQLVPFARARLEPLAILAHAAREVRATAGSAIATADRAAIVVEGTLRAGERVLQPGDNIGVLETLAGSRLVTRCEALTDARVLVSSADTIFDVLEDHTDFALAILETFARMLVDDDARSVCAPCTRNASSAHDSPAIAALAWNAS